MATLKISAQEREGTGKSVTRKMRQAGRIPAVLYGRAQDGISLSLDTYEVSQILSTEGARTSILELEFQQGGKSSKRNVFIKEVQKHPYRDIILHMDLLEVSMDREISVMVPIETVGIPKGVKIDGGILEMKRRELEIVCLPGNIPDVITIDVSNLEIGDNVHVEDVPVPEGVTIPHEVNFTLMTVVGASVEVEAEEAEEEEAAEKAAEAEEEEAEEE